MGLMWEEIAGMRLADWVKDYLRTRRTTQLAIGHQLGSSNNMPVYRVLQGAPIKESEIEKWVEALELDGYEKEHFELLCHLELSSEWLRVQYLKQEHQIKTLKRENQANLDLIREIVKEARRRVPGFPDFGIKGV